MNTYIAIDLHSGLVWGRAEASDALDAARRIDIDIDGERGRTYSECSSSDAHALYAIHKVPTAYLAESKGWFAEDFERAEQACGGAVEYVARADVD